MLNLAVGLLEGRLAIMNRLKFPVKMVSILFGILTIIVAFQNCSKSKTPSQGSYNLASVDSVPPCAPSNPKSCNTANGVGIYTCSADGVPGDCLARSCNAGFNLINGACVAKLCNAGTQISCRTSNGSGVQVCNPDGNGYGSCAENSCNSGFILQNGICTSQTCVENATQQCNIMNGVGIQKCVTDLNRVTSWGACTPSSCNSGYILSGGACVSGVCVPGATKDCSNLNGNGSQTCLSSAVWGSCQYSSCNSGYNLQGGLCVANLCTPNSTTVACSENNGLGIRYCNNSGTGYGACYLNLCNSGFYYMNGVCIAQSCDPGAQQSCVIENGKGAKTCNNQGTGFGACQLTACNLGYKLQGGVCVNDPNSGLCTNAGQFKSNGSDVGFVCDCPSSLNLATWNPQTGTSCYHLGDYWVGSCHRYTKLVTAASTALREYACGCDGSYAGWTYDGANCFYRVVADNMQ